MNYRKRFRTQRFHKQLNLALETKAARHGAEAVIGRLNREVLEDQPETDKGTERRAS